MTDLERCCDRATETRAASTLQGTVVLGHLHIYRRFNSGPSYDVFAGLHELRDAVLDDQTQDIACTVLIFQHIHQEYRNDTDH